MTHSGTDTRKIVKVEQKQEGTEMMLKIQDLGCIKLACAKAMQNVFFLDRCTHYHYHLSVVQIRNLLANCSRMFIFCIFNCKRSMMN